jgi:hypothetical protein
MLQTTNFKRIALVAVAALGMGVLSSAPSQAAFSGTAGSQLTITVENGTGSLEGSASDSTTAATVTVKGLALANSDSYTITAVKKSWPAATTGALTPRLVFGWIDTETVGSTGAVILTGRTEGTTDTTTAKSTGALTTNFGGVFSSATDSFSAVSATAPASGGANTYVNSKWYAWQDSGTATDRIAGTYTYTLIITPRLGEGTPQTADVTITIAALASASLVASPGSSTAFIGTATGATSDTALSALATASDTPVGYIQVALRNASETTASATATARESVTITTTIGQVGTSTNRGRSVVLVYGGGASGVSYNVYADGTAGSGTITISTPSVTFSTKTVNFYTAKPASLVASVPTPNLKVGENKDAIRVTAKDANGNAWTGTLYVYASAAADAAIAGNGTTTTGTSCSYDSADGRHECAVTGITAGTAKMKLTNYSTTALATAADAATAGSSVTSNEVSVVVNSNTAASVKISFDKATYAPNERARIYVTPLDSAGKELAANTISNLLATGGISSNAGFTFSGSTTTADSLTAVSITPAANTSSATGAKAGSQVYTVFMPSAGGTVTINATGGSSLPVAGQVAVTASATVTDSGAAALAAVNALATTVASLRTLITTLTNLVLKIQKKVKA